jgi:hypothetical protein
MAASRRSALALFLSGALLTACAYDWKVADAGQSLDDREELEDASDRTPEDGGDTPRSAPPREHPDAGDIDASAPTVARDMDDARAPDAVQTAPHDSSPSDAGDSRAEDAPPVDASEPDAAPAPFSCAHVDAAFCESFEHDSLDVFSWQELTPDSGASVSLIADGAGGFALKSALDGADDEAARAVVRLTNGAPSWFRASFDFLPSLSFPATGDEHIFWFRLTEQSGDAYRGIFLGSRSDGTYLILQNFDGVNETWDPYPTAALPSGWVHVELELRFGTNGSATLRFNGAVALAFTGAVQVVNVEQSFVQLGLYAEPATVSSALYDNLVIEFAR